MFYKIFLFCVLLQAASICARKYDKCTLAKELYDQYKFPRNQIGTWICIVKHESNFDTTARNTQTNDHGLFQISELYWCDPPDHPDGCHVTCDSLRDDDISNDVKCVKKVFAEFQKLKGNGFEAWTTYKDCKGDQESYISDCKL